jgi:cation transport ATPase
VGRRSRKRRAEPAPAPARGPRASRSEAKNAAVREQLEPLEEGERPTAVTVGAAVAVGLVVANLVVYAAGWNIRGDRPALAGFIVFSILMLTMAWGLWRAKYWAVLGLEALLGILIVYVALIALLFSSVTDVILALAILLPAGTLFWKLVKAMARIQMPKRPEPRR